MGQYYKTLLLDPRTGSRTVIRPEWLKLMEHSYKGNDSVGYVCSKLVGNPQRIAWVGDYSDNEMFTPKTMTVEEWKDCFDFVWCNEDESSTIDLHTELRDDRTDDKAELEAFRYNQKEFFCYLINHTKKQYLSFRHYYRNMASRFGLDEGCSRIHPLPMLTAVGNGMGCGDFSPSKSGTGSKDVGIWAMDEISISTEKPREYEEIDVMFVENTNSQSSYDRDTDN